MGARLTVRSTRPMRVLIVERDNSLRHLIARRLCEEGHVSDALAEASFCLEYVTATQYDAVVLDELSAVHALRSQNVTTPLLVLAAQSDPRDVVAALDAGADDHLAKPFAFEELLARLRSLTRRPPTWSDDLLRCGDLVFDRRTREARRGGRGIELTSREIAMLEALIRNAGRIVTREALIDAVWNRDAYPESNVLDVYARRLRIKLNGTGEPPLLHTVRGVGFKLSKRG